MTMMSGVGAGVAVAAGVVAAATGGTTGGCAVDAAIGVGVNCASHPTGTDYPATDLAAAGATVTPSVLLARLAVRTMERLAQWAAGEGFSTVRADWIARAAGLGEDIRVRLADRELSGRFETVDADGSMILRLPDGRAATVTAGDTLCADVFSVREDAGVHSVEVDA